MHCIGGACQFGELLSDESRDQVMSNSYSAAPSAPMVAWATEVRSALCSKTELPGMLPGVRQCSCRRRQARSGRRSWWEWPRRRAPTATFMGDPPGRRGFLRRAGGRRLRCFTDYSQHGFNSTHVFRAVGVFCGYFKVVLLFLLRGLCWLVVWVHKLPSVSSDF